MLNISLTLEPIFLRLLSLTSMIYLTWFLVYHFYSVLINPFLTLFAIRVGTLCPNRFFCWMWEHQWSWESEIFREFLKFTKALGLKKCSSKILYLGVSGPFARNFSDIWKMVFTWSIPKFSQQKLNLLVIHCYFVSNVTMTD